MPAKNFPTPARPPKRTRSQRAMAAPNTTERGNFVIEEMHPPRGPRERHTQAKYVAEDPERYQPTVTDCKPPKDSKRKGPGPRRSTVASTYRMNRSNVKRKPEARRGRIAKKLSGDGK
jgi:hypothetical protein